ncbi:MAG: hypothetical protein LUE86_08785 [Clostridiales bacterium]|nr:hypothetical protein [Clostridiales bacterium]
MDKKEFTKKKLIVSTEDILRLMANDPDITWPVTICIRKARTEGSYIAHSKEELTKLVGISDIHYGYLSSLSKGPKGTYVEVQRNGSLFVDVAVLPAYRHMSELYDQAATDLYHILLYPEAYTLDGSKVKEDVYA